MYGSARRSARPMYAALTRPQTNMLMGGLKSTFTPPSPGVVGGYGVQAPGAYGQANFPGGLPATAFDPSARMQMGLPAWTGVQAQGYAGRAGVTPEALMSAGGLGGMAGGPSPQGSPGPFGLRVMAPTGPRPTTGPRTIPGRIPAGADPGWDQMQYDLRRGLRPGANLPTRFR